MPVKALKVIPTPPLLGYRGNTPFDAAAFYCPYIPLTCYSPGLEPLFNEPYRRISFNTHYGIIVQA
jgi:hypothetical protein